MKKSKKAWKKPGKKNSQKQRKNEYAAPPIVWKDAELLNFPKTKISHAIKTLFFKYEQVLSEEQSVRFEEFLRTRESTNIEKEEVYTFLRENPDIRKRIWI